MSLKTPKKLKKMLTKSPASSGKTATFKKVDFSWSSLGVTKLSKF